MWTSPSRGRWCTTTLHSSSAAFSLLRHRPTAQRSAHDCIWSCLRSSPLRERERRMVSSLCEQRHVRRAWEMAATQRAEEPSLNVERWAEDLSICAKATERMLSRIQPDTSSMRTFRPRPHPHARQPAPSCKGPRSRPPGGIDHDPIPMTSAHHHRAKNKSPARGRIAILRVRKANTTFPHRTERQTSLDGRLQSPVGASLLARHDRAGLGACIATEGFTDWYEAWKRQRGSHRAVHASLQTEGEANPG